MGDNQTGQVHLQIMYFDEVDVGRPTRASLLMARPPIPRALKVTGMQPPDPLTATLLLGGVCLGFTATGCCSALTNCLRGIAGQDTAHA